jgi:hypothetical protein
MTIKGDINRNTDAVENAAKRAEELHAMLLPFVTALLARLGDSRGVEMAVRIEFLPAVKEPTP